MLRLRGQAIITARNFSLGPPNALECGAAPGQSHSRSQSDRRVAEFVRLPANQPVVGISAGLGPAGHETF